MDSKIILASNPLITPSSPFFVTPPFIQLGHHHFLLCLGPGRSITSVSLQDQLPTIYLTPIERILYLTYMPNFYYIPLHHPQHT